MPLIKGTPQDTVSRPLGRIANTHRLLTAAAVIMSCFLLISSFETVVLIPAQAFESGGAANGRALAYLAHTYLGFAFGTVYDLSTIAILWFAGASAMAGLLNIVPRYLPKYGMAPDWARATRPLVLVYGAIAFIVTLVFQANVEAQGSLRYGRFGADEFGGIGRNIGSYAKRCEAERSRFCGDYANLSLHNDCQHY